MDPNETDIAIAGLAGRFPGAPDVPALWELILRNENALEAKQFRANFDPTAPHWVTSNCLLPDADYFDAGFFGFSSLEASITDPQHRVFLECCWQVLEEGGLSASERLDAVGVFGGSSFSGYFPARMHQTGKLIDQLPYIIGNDKDYLATRVSHLLGLGGPSYTVLAACSTSLVAVHLACRSLLAGECDAAIAGGVNIVSPRRSEHFYLPGGLLSPEDACRPFDKDARGTVFAEGVGAVLLMRLEDALRARCQIHAVIVGSAVNNDGDPTVGFTGPSSFGQFRAIRGAQLVSETEPAAIGYVEAHGTGTTLGDAIEVGALAKAFGQLEPGSCALGSVKSNIGHLATAAGIAGLIKATLAVREGIIPAHPTLLEESPTLKLSSTPFYLPTVAAGWPLNRGPRIAGISSFGIGGTNAHVILREPPSRTPPPTSRRRLHPLPISARTDEALDAALEQTSEFCGKVDPLEFADLAYTLSAKRRRFERRAMVIATDANEVVETVRGQKETRHARRAEGATSPIVAFLYPGQGTQYMGMGADLYRSEPIFREALDECIALALDNDAVDLRPLLLGERGDVGEISKLLRRTEFAQPAILAVEVALTRLLASVGIEPAFVMGHSLGEYAAAVTSGVFALGDAFRLICARAKLMQELEGGAMIAVSASSAQLSPLLPPGVELAAVNAPLLSVLSGDRVSIEAFRQALGRQGIATTSLPTSHAFHSAMLDPMLLKYGSIVETVPRRQPMTPLVSNISGDLVDHELEESSYWVNHARQSVLFNAGLETLCAQGVTHFLEVGPGNTLKSIAAQCQLERRGIRVASTMGGHSRIADDDAFLRGVGNLWLSGVPVHWAGLYAAEERSITPAPTYCFQRKRFWLDADQSGEQASDPQSLRKQPVDQWFYSRSWQRLSSPISEDTRSGSTLVFTHDRSARVLDYLHRTFGRLNPLTAVALGDGFREVDDGLYEIDPSSPEDYSQLFAMLSKHFQRIDRIVHCWSIPTRPDLSSPTTLRSHGILSLERILREYNRFFHAAPVTFVIVTAGMNEVTGGETLCPENSALLGFLLVAPDEHTHIKARVIDIDSRSRFLHPEVRAELQAADSESLVAVRGRFRWGLRIEACPPALGGSRRQRLKRNGVYLIVGGLGHVGSIVAKYLASKWAAHLVLVGRGTPPARGRGRAEDENGTAQEDLARAATIEELRANASSMTILQADAANSYAMAEVKLWIQRQHGGLDGIIYAAGALASNITAADETALAVYAEHYHAKVDGVRVLCETFGDQDLDFCLLFSSISVVLGQISRCAYVCGNAVADALILERNRSRRGTWTTVNWDLWEGTNVGWATVPESATSSDVYSGTVLSGILEHIAERSITANEAGDAIEWLLGAPPQSQIMVSTASLHERVRFLRQRAEASVVATEGRNAVSHLRPDLDTPYEAPTGPIECGLCEIWEELVGSKGLGRDDDFFELGGNSLIAVRLAARVRSLYNIDIKVDEIFAHTTIRQQAVFIENGVREFVTSLSEQDALSLIRRISSEKQG